MSSLYVRQSIKDFLAANSEEDVIDMTAMFAEVREMLADNNLQPDAPWLGLRFQGDSEDPIGLAATNDQGKYRETGLIYFDVVATARIGVGDSILTRGEVLRDLFRGERIGDIIIQSVSPINTEPGTTLEFDGGYMSGSFFVAYIRDLDL